MKLADRKLHVCKVDDGKALKYSLEMNLTFAVSGILTVSMKDLSFRKTFKVRPVLSLDFGKVLDSLSFYC